MSAEAQELVRRLYGALGTGDRDTLLVLLHDDFEASFCEGLPAGLGGVRHGAGQAIDEGWWPIGRAYALLAEPEEWIGCDDGRLLVRGRYLGKERATGFAVDAAFMHLWTARDGRLVGLRQLTDSARWTR